jgi:hypothetical protein
MICDENVFRVQAVRKGGDEKSLAKMWLREEVIKKHL